MKSIMNINPETLRIATQVREFAIQGITLKNTFKEMGAKWEELKTKDGVSLIVEQMGTKLKYQLINLYAIDLIKYMNSIVGLDLVPLAQQDLKGDSLRRDAFILNVSGLRINDHEQLFRLMLINLFGINDFLVDFAFDPDAKTLREYVLATYSVDLGTDAITSAEPIKVSIEMTEKALGDYIQNPEFNYALY